MSLYEGVKTRVRVGSDLSEDFEVKVGVHQGSVLSPLLFAITEDAREGLMSEMLYADDENDVRRETHRQKEGCGPEEHARSGGVC